MVGKPPTTPAKPLPIVRRAGFARIVSRRTLNPTGEVFRAWYACGDCKAAVDLHDRFCRSCGVPFWTPRPWARSVRSDGGQND